MTLLVGLGCPLGASGAGFPVLLDRADENQPDGDSKLNHQDQQDDGAVGDPVRILAATTRHTGTTSDIA